MLERETSFQERSLRNIIVSNTTGTMVKHIFAYKAEDSFQSKDKAHCRGFSENNHKKPESRTRATLTLALVTLATSSSKKVSCVASNELLAVDNLGKLSGITAKVLSCQRKEDSGNSQKLKHKVQGNPTTVVNTHLPISTTNNWWTKIKCAAIHDS